MSKTKILKKRIDKATKHYKALSEYKKLIDNLIETMNIYDLWTFNTLPYEKRAILEAYLKRFASLQDYLGAKLFPLMLECAGIGTSKMSEVLYMVEKEEIIDSFESWIKLREISNDLEHDYPDEMKEALQNLKYCIENFEKLESYYKNSIIFAQKYIK